MFLIKGINLIDNKDNKIIKQKNIDKYENNFDIN